MSKRLYKTNQGAMIAGVCAGLGEYFDIDATLIRLAFVVLTFMGGSGLLAYLIAAIVIPDKGEGDGRWRPTGDDRTYYDATTVDEGKTDTGWQATQTDTASGSNPQGKKPASRSNTQALLAYVLIGIGSYMLIEKHFRWYRIVGYLRPYWPAILVVAGLALLLNSTRKA